jgi:hypothetical protein
VNDIPHPACGGPPDAVSTNCPGCNKPMLAVGTIVSMIFNEWPWLAYVEVCECCVDELNHDDPAHSKVIMSNLQQFIRFITGDAEGTS